MRLRMPVLASASVAAAAVAVPAIAGAAPIHNRALTIHTTVNHITAGTPLTIYGRLMGRDHGDQEITLYHRINPAKTFTVVGHTRTNANGQYDFVRADGVVETNRSWFVRGPVYTHSRTLHERVAAELTLNASATTGTTRHPLTFTGTVSPNQVGSRVALQVQYGDGDSWHTVKYGRVGTGSTYSISYRWSVAGPRNVRVAFIGDARNTGAQSDPVSIVINQRQAPYFTIAASNTIVANGTPVTISGTLYKPHTSTPSSGVEVGLYKHIPGGKWMPVVQQAKTGTDGGYTFTTESSSNELYQVRTIGQSPAQATAQQFVGVQDQVSMSANTDTWTVGGPVTFTGSVAPAKTGHLVYLEKLGTDGHWQVVETSTVNSMSQFTFHWTFAAPGSKSFRARVLGGSVNIGGASAPVTETVPVPMVTQLPNGG